MSQTRIDVSIQKINKCAECFWFNNTENNNGNIQLCEHPKLLIDHYGQEIARIINCWQMEIPKWCPLDKEEDVKKIIIERKIREMRIIWPEDKSSSS
ncbi:MAG: hypothetical protein H8D97_01255 [Proteobacteria bacterium]|nr:hypothetical protein [Pseudomonadota bacterium]